MLLISDIVKTLKNLRTFQKDLDLDYETAYLDMIMKQLRKMVYGTILMETSTVKQVLEIQVFINEFQT